MIFVNSINVYLKSKVDNNIISIIIKRKNYI